MKDFLLDLIQHVNLDGVDLIKVVGTDKETRVAAIGEGNSVIINGKFNTPIPEFAGTFGMPNLTNLKTILGFDDYDEHAVISVVRETRDGVDNPSTIHFATQDGSFVNDYRLMGKALAEDQVKNLSLKVAPKWAFEFEPTLAGIARLKKQASANNTEVQFTTTTVGGDLKISFGDPSTHSGNFVFQPQVGGTLDRGFMWPVKSFLSILDLPGDKIIRISNQSLAEITVNSNIATYSYMFPSHSK